MAMPRCPPQCLTVTFKRVTDRQHKFNIPPVALCAACRSAVGNGMLHVAFRLLASLTDSQTAMDQVTVAWLAYYDCLPLGPAAEPPSRETPGR